MDTEFKEDKKKIIPIILIIILVVAILGLLIFKPDIIGLNTNTPIDNKDNNLILMRSSKNILVYNYSEFQKGNQVPNF